MTRHNVLELTRGTELTVAGRPAHVEDVRTYVEDGHWAVEVAVVYENGDWAVIEDPDLLRPAE